MKKCMKKRNEDKQDIKVTEKSEILKGKEEKRVGNEEIKNGMIKG